MSSSLSFATQFFPGASPRFFPEKVLVATCGPLQPAKHLFAPCLHAHRNGQLLIVVRWDGHGAEEGDATNEQALFFSRDSGATWILAGEGPILTAADGSSFAIPSSLTEAWIFEDLGGRTWLYYSVNQPFTWGEGRPERSTGGGEIRRREIAWDGATWSRRGASSVVWAFHQPLPDGRGGVCHDIRAISWNGLIRMRDGALIMPIGGRSSVMDPRGAFSRLNRVWILISRDDGATWPEAHFLGGDDALCIAEPTLVETSTPGQLVCLLRVQYQTGNQLHRSVSPDGGRTWSSPQPTGLPQANMQGVKPHLIRLRSGRYALIQTNEHEVIERTNLAIFLTDERGLLSDEWPHIRTLHVGNRRGWWPGSCYGWLAEADDGALLAAFPCHDVSGGKLLFARLRPDDLQTTPALVPNGVADEWGDHVPTLSGSLTPGGELSFVFSDIRGRLVAPDFGRLRRSQEREIKFWLCVNELPATASFVLLRLTARNGREESGTLLIDRSGWHWRDARSTQRIEGPVGLNGWLEVRCRLSAKRIALELGGENSGFVSEMDLTTSPTGLQFGGSAEPSPCRFLLGQVTYGVLAPERT